MLSEKYKLETVVKEPSVIYMERPLKAASHTIHIEVPPNPFWASIGLSVTPLSLGSGVQYESRVSLGYLNQSFQNAVRDGIRYGLEQGLFGWNVTDCKICFEYGLYYSPVSTPADFRSLAPIVLEQALKESGTQLLEPYLSFILYAPQEYLSRAYHDAPKYCATIETAQVKKDEVVFTGEIPARCILSIVIFVIVYGRMIEIYMMVSLAPVPMATWGNHEQSHVGQNYLRSLFALGFQGFLILICVAIYAVLLQNVAISGDAINSIWSIVGYTVLLCFSLFKTGSVARSILGAH